jgi:MFS family permease
MIAARDEASRTLAIALVVAFAQFMQMLDAAVISIALPPMARDFHVSPVAVGFGITIYVLTAWIVIPASAWLADRVRRTQPLRALQTSPARRCCSRRSSARRSAAS